MATETETQDIRKRAIIGGPQNEDTDFETAVRGMLEADFEDWPNEAGVSSHYTIFTRIIC